jgi:hypothetical protein
MLPFDIVFGYLVYFIPVLVCCAKKKSGNPATDVVNVF